MSSFDFSSPNLTGDYDYNTVPLGNYDLGFGGGSGQSTSSPSAGSIWGSVKDVFNSGLSIAGDIIGMESAWNHRGATDPWAYKTADQVANANAAQAAKAAKVASVQGRQTLIPPTIGGINTMYLIGGGLLAAVLLLKSKK
jgi:hypothetical protein